MGLVFFCNWQIDTTFTLQLVWMHNRMTKAFEAFVKHIYDGLSLIYGTSQKTMFFKYCKRLFNTSLIMNAVFNSKLPCK